MIAPSTPTLTPRPRPRPRPTPTPTSTPTPTPTPTPMSTSRPTLTPTEGERDGKRSDLGPRYNEAASYRNARMDARRIDKMHFVRRVVARRRSDDAHAYARPMRIAISRVL